MFVDLTEEHQGCLEAFQLSEDPHPFKGDAFRTRNTEDLAQSVTLGKPHTAQPAVSSANSNDGVYLAASARTDVIGPHKGLSPKARGQLDLTTLC